MSGLNVGTWRGALALALALAGVAPAAGQTFEVTSGRVVVVCPLTVGGRFEVTTTRRTRS